MPEAHLHELDGLPPDAQRRVFERASVGGTPTANRIREVREAMEAGRLDVEGQPLPLTDQARDLAKLDELLASVRRIGSRYRIEERVAPLLDQLQRLFGTIVHQQRCGKRAAAG